MWGWGHLGWRRWGRGKVVDWEMVGGWCGRGSWRSSLGELSENLVWRLKTVVARWECILEFSFDQNH